MSLVITRSLFCDGVGRPEDGGACPQWFAENTDSTPAQIRSDARTRGWTRRRVPGAESQDLCPECSGPSAGA